MSTHKFPFNDRTVSIDYITGSNGSDETIRIEAEHADGKFDFGELLCVNGIPTYGEGLDLFTTYEKLLDQIPEIKPVLASIREQRD